MAKIARFQPFSLYVYEALSKSINGVYTEGGSDMRSSHLMPPVSVSENRVMILFALPQAHVNQLQAMTLNTQIPRSDLVEKFLGWGWQTFIGEALHEAMPHYWKPRIPGGTWIPNSRPPDWLNPVINHHSIRMVLAVPIAEKWWKELASCMAWIERKTLICELTDVMILFFAWGWYQFEQMTLDLYQGQGELPQTLSA